MKFRCIKSPRRITKGCYSVVQRIAGEQLYPRPQDSQKNRWSTRELLLREDGTAKELHSFTSLLTLSLFFLFFSFLSFFLFFFFFFVLPTFFHSLFAVCRSKSASAFPEANKNNSVESTALKNGGNRRIFELSYQTIVSFQ